jgi:hypothetical protein
MNYQEAEEKYISKFHGMELYPLASDDKRGNENGILFLATYYMLKKENNELIQSDIFTFNEIVRNLRTNNPVGGHYQGLFDRGMNESLQEDKTKIRTISHDNLSAIVAFSHAFNLPYHRYACLHGSENQWRFDNAYPESPRWSRMSHIRDIIYWSRLGGGKLSKSVSWCFMWFFYLTQILTCQKKTHVRPSLFHRLRTLLAPSKYPDSGYRVKDYATSGKQLAFVRLYPLRKTSKVARVVWWLCTKIVGSHKKGGFAYVFEYYYKNEDHPIRALAKKVFK